MIANLCRFYKGKEIDYTQRTYKFKFMSKDKSIQALGKFLGMAIDKLDISGTIGVVTFASAVSDLHDELEKEQDLDFLQ